MKKILALLMAVCLMAAMLTGCGSAPAEPAQPAAESVRRGANGKKLKKKLASGWKIDIVLKIQNFSGD